MSKRQAIKERTIRKNKAVNTKLIKDAEQLGRDLEALGVKEKRGYRLSHPLDGRILKNKRQIRASSSGQLHQKKTPTHVSR